MAKSPAKSEMTVARRIAALAPGRRHCGCRQPASSHSTTHDGPRRGGSRRLGSAGHHLPQRVAAASPGAGIFLVAKYENVAASFSGYGRLGKPSEAVADEAVTDFRDHHASAGAVELHLADQLLLSLSFAAGNSIFTTPRPTKHLLTNAWTIGQFAIANISIEQGTPCRVDVRPRQSS